MKYSICLVAVLLIAALSNSAWARCPPNSERYFDYTIPKCRCITGYIVNRGECMPIDVYRARTRAYELINSKRSSCDAMAQSYNEIAWASGFDVIKLSNYVREVFANERSIYYVMANDSGFLPKYRDGSNQVRHFTAYFTVGVTFSSDKAVWPITYALDAFEKADIALAKKAAEIGERASENRQVVEKIGKTIRDEACSD